MSNPPARKVHDFTISVRATHLDDWQALYHMREEAAVRYNVLAMPYENPENVRERVSHQSANTYSLVAEAIWPDGKCQIAGNLGLSIGKLAEAHSGGFGIQVSTEFQGMGVGSALMAAMCEIADRWLDLHRIELEVFSDNQAGMALYKKFGFEIEATMRRYAFRDGAYTDAYIMGRINPHHGRGSNL